MSRLGYYLTLKARNYCPGVEFEPLLRQDATRRLQQLRNITLFQLRIRASYANELLSADEDVFRAFAAARRLSHAEEIEIILRPKPRSRDLLDIATLGLARRLSRRRRIREEVDRFVVRGFDPDKGGIDEIDVLSDELIAAKRITKLHPRTRALDPESAFSAIEAAYREMGSDLIRAASVSG